MTNPARPGPPNDPPQPGPRKPAPRWAHFIWWIGLVLTALLLFGPRASKAPTSLAFSEWKTKVDGGQMKTATIDTAGKVTGQLNDKAQTKYTSRIPTALNDNTLAADLE